MKKRILFSGTILMLFLGLIYAWSLFAAPLEDFFNWNRSQTSMTFSISMITFCLGNVISSMILRRSQPRTVVLTSAGLFLLGFFFVSMITSIWGLYVFYGVMCGLGTGLSYNAILSTVPKWHPEQAGSVTGILLMGMGLGSLLLGTVVRRMMDILIWQTTFKILAVIFFLLFGLAAFSIINPGAAKGDSEKRAPETPGTSRDYPLLEMLRTQDFWMLFLWATITSSVGLGIVSNASYMAQEVGALESMLPLLVGMVSVGNGGGRLIFGRIVDTVSGKKAMHIGNMVFLAGLALSILASMTGILIFLVIGFALGGIGYGAPPTLSAALTKKKFGEKYFPENLSAIILVLIPASLIGPTITANIYRQTGYYFASYLVMLAMILLAFLPAVIYREG
ncbi:MAG: OFA family MFS transporter [Firmicutes bacterium]|nr:OFA family MFS transporter [Bacillota bacterium]